MDLTIAKRVETWFRKHGGDGEFVCRERGTPYVVIGCKRNRGHAIFTTKPQTVIASVGHRQTYERFGLIGGYGLPDRADLSLFRRIIGQRSLAFLGDLDPTDLMVFAWLRGCLGKTRVFYLGVNDALMRAAKVPSCDLYRIPLSRSERNAMQHLLELFPDLQTTVGTDCAGILMNKSKVELEAVLPIPFVVPTLPHK